MGNNTFNPDAYLAKQKRSFDPNAYLAKLNRPAAEEPGLVSSSLRGLGQGLSYGNLDELKGLVGSKDEDRAANKAAEATHPFVYGTSKLIGNIAAPAAVAAFGVPMGAAAALGLGGLQAFGESEASNLKDLALDTAIGAGAGLVAGKVGELASKGISAAAPAIKSGLNAVGEFVSPVTSRIGNVGKMLGDFTESAGDTLTKQGLGVVNKYIGTNFDTGAEKLTSSLLPDAAKKEIGKRLTNTALGAGSIAGGSTYLGLPVAPLGVAGGVIQAGRILSEPAGKALVSAAQALGPYGKIIMDAAVRGPAAVSTTDYLLQQKSPEYREMRNRVLGSENPE